MFLLVEDFFLSEIKTLVRQGVIWTSYLLSCSFANPFTQFPGEDSAYFMRKALEDLSDMQDLPDEGFPYRKQVTVLFLSWSVMIIC